MKNIFLISFLFSSICVLGQSGPGGVGNSTTNKLWLKANDLSSLGNGNPISTWTDASGNGNNATQTGSSQPIFITNALNFKPAVRFDGIDDFFSNVFNISTQNQTIYTVFSHNMAGTCGPLWQLWQNVDGSGFFPNCGGNQYIHYGGNWLTKTSTFTKNVWYQSIGLYKTGATELWSNGSLNHSIASNTIGYSTFQIGKRNTDFYNGDIAEIIYYNIPLNDAQRIILDNYISSKYATTISNDKFAYDATHSNDVAGIGRVDASNTHLAAQSGGILQVSSPSAMADGDFLLFGHDGASVGSWTSTETPSSDVNLKRIAREWKFNKTGTVGTVSLSFDTTLLPSKVTNYDFYLLWVDADGDFTSGATPYPVTLSGSQYLSTGVTIAEGNYVTISTFRPVIQFATTTVHGVESASSTITLSTNFKASRSISINFSDAGTGTATGSGTDYSLPSSPVTLSAGSSSVTFNPTIINDAVVESDETINLNLSSTSSGVVGTNSSFTYTINDDDNARKIDFSTTSSNAAETTTSVTLTVQINNVDLVNPTTVNYAVTGGTATGGGIDYTLASGTATIAAGATTTTILVSIVNDLVNEANETIIITLSNPSNANLGTNSVYTYTINDDDAAPTVQFLTSSSNGIEGVSPASVTVSLSSPSGQDVAVDYADAGTGTATGGGTDYSLTSGTLTIPAGSLSATFNIIIVDDATIEGPETINLSISNPTGGASLGTTTTHTFTLNDNDVSLGFSGPGGVGNSTNNKLWLKADDLTAIGNGNPVSTWTDASGSGNNAIQGTAGSNPIWMTNIVNGKPAVRFDGVDDYYSNVFNVTSQNQTIYTIFAHNMAGTCGPLWQIQQDVDGSGFFPNCGGNQYINYGGNWLTKTSTFTKNIWYQSIGLYKTGATELWSNGALNHSIASNTVTGSTFQIGKRNTDFYNGDIAEIIYYNTDLNSAQRIIVDNYISTKYGLTISNDKYSYDATHSYEVAGIGREDASNIHVAGQSGGILKVNNASALADGDYLLFGHDNGSIAGWTTTEAPNAGVNTQRLAREWRFNKTGTIGTVTLSVDTTLLPTKPSGYNQYVIYVDADGDFTSGAVAFKGTLSGSTYFASGVTISNGYYVSIGLVRPSIQFTSSSSNGLESAAASIQISLDYARTSNTTVNYTVTGGTATSGSDYIFANGTATILAGQTTTNITPSILNDVLVESDETIIITLSSPSSGVALGTKSVNTYTINDDDNSRKIDFSSTSSNGDESVTSVTLTVRINNIDAVNPTTVDYSVTGGTATGGGLDYTLTSGTATIAAGATTTTITFSIIDDLLNEANETIIISLSNPTNSNLGTNQIYTYTINNNDAAPTVQFLTATSNGIEGVTPSSIYVNLSAPSGQDVTIDYADAGTGTATGNGTDYTFFPGTLTIPAGSTNASFNINIVDDASIEAPETIVLTISNPSGGASLGTTTTHTFTLNDNDVSMGFSGPGGVGNSTNNKLWLKADDLTSIGNGNPVATWIDASGSGNNAAQGTAGSRPLLITNVINGKPAVRFDGVDDSYSNVFNVTAQNQTVVTVFSHNMLNSCGPLWQLQQDGGNSGFFPNCNGSQYLWYGSNWLTKASTFTKNIWYQTDAIYSTGNTEIWSNGTLNHNIASNTVIGSTFQIGKRTTDLYNGDIAEIIYYNTNLNSAQRIIVDNYLSSKYGTTIGDDKYSYDASHPNDVAGIGREDASNIHSAAQSARILKVSNASGLGDGEYLLFGHNAASITAWTTTEAPNAGVNTQRLAREWKFNQTGNVGTVTLTVDTTLLPALPSGFSQYMIYLDADGDFSSGATAYQASQSGSTYFASGITIPNGYFISIGIVRPSIQFTATSSSGFENGLASIPVSIDYVRGSNTTVNYTVTGGTATAGSDYILANGTATIVAGQTTVNITPSIINDVIIESDETIVITLSSPSSGVALGTNTVHTYTIHDDDNTRKIEFASTSSNGSESVASVTLTVQINNVDLVNPTTVNYSVTGGTATGGGVDYTLASGTATVAAGTTTTTFSFSVADDLFNEANETVIISLSSPTNSNVGINSVYTYTINDNDAAPTIQFLTSSSNGIEGVSPAAVYISLSSPSGQNVTVDYADAGTGTATGGGTDYTFFAGTLTIPAGSTTGSFNIGIVDDASIESPETINFTISNPTGVSLGTTTTHTFTINDNDVSMGFSGPGGVGNSVNNKLWLKADVLTGANGSAVSTWTDASGSGNNAVQSTGTSQPLLMTNILNSKPVVRFDGVDDYFPNIFNVTATNQTVITVFAHNMANSCGPLWQLQQDAGSSGFFPNCSGSQYLWYGSNWLTKASTFSQNNWYQTFALYKTGSTELWSNGTSNDMIASNTVTGSTFQIAKRSTDFYKGDIAELIYYNTDLNSAQRTIVDNYLSTKYGNSISNDKYTYDISHGNDVAGIGREDASNLHSAAQSAGILKISNPGGMVDGDYLLFGHDAGSISAWTGTESPNGGINTERITREWRFNKTGTVGSVSVSIDTTLLPSKPVGYDQYIVWVDADGDFSNGAIAYPANLSGGVYLANSVSISDGYFVSFGLTRSTIQFTTTTSSSIESSLPSNIQINLSAARGTSTTVNYTIMGGTATAGVDYILANGTATIIAGQTTTNIVPSIINDAVVEGDETIIITLSNPSSGVALGTPSIHTYTINDDDNSRKIDFTSTSSNGAESTTTVTLTVQVNNVDLVNPTTVNYVASGTATGGGVDYTLASGPVTIPAGSSTATFNLTIVDDAVKETNETVIISLSSPTNSNLGTNKVYTYTINDDDVAPTIQFTSSAVSATEGTTPGTLQVSMSAASGQTVTVDYTVTGGTATANTDYILSNGTITIAAGNTTGSINITIIDDAVSESNETIQITLSNPSGATLGSTTVGTYTIIDNDASLGGFTGPGGVGNSTYNKLWLKAEDMVAIGNGNPLGTWTDASGNGNNAVQGTASSKPLLMTNILNSKSVVRFDGVDDYFPNVFTVTSQNQTIFTVFSHNMSGTCGPLWQLQQDANSSGFFPNCGGSQYLWYGSNWLTKPSTFTINTWYQTMALYKAGATELWSGGVSNHTIASNTVTGSTFQIAKRLTDFYNGDIAEIIYYNTSLNTAQRIIVDNYLASKYNKTIANDKFSYDATHSYDVAGIGYDDASNYHSAAQSAGIVKISTASSLDVAGDYLMFGHDNASITSWSSTEAPSGIKRLAREWKFDQNGTVGTVTVTIDTALLPARDNGYSLFLLLDGDGDFTTTDNIYNLVLVSGSTYKVDNLTLTSGKYICIGEINNITARSGNFGTGSTWVSGIVPGSGQQATIASGHTVTLTANQNIGSLIVSTGGTLSLSSNTLTIDAVNGTLSVAGGGTVNMGTGTVAYAASGAQNITPLNYYNLTIAGSGTKSLTAATTVSNVLTLTAGTLSSGGYLTMDLSTAAIDKSGTGSLTGNMTVTRTITPAGYHYFSSPLQGTTYADITDDTPINPYNFFVYNESIPNYISVDGKGPSLSSQKMTGGPTTIVGYALQFYAASTAFDMTGTYSHGASYSSGSLAYTANTTPSLRGFHLIGNPFPSYIDWNSSAITKVNLNAGMTMYNCALGQNADYIPDQGAGEAKTNNASPYIPAMQAFWVQTNASNASITVGNNARILNPPISGYGSPSYYRKKTYTTPLLKLALENNGFSDETVIRFTDLASDNFDDQLDVYKQKNSLPCPSFYTGIEGNEYAINSFPSVTSEKEVPLSMDIPSSGKYTISVKQFENFIGAGTVLLEDKKLNIITDLTQDSSYTFDLSMSDVGRFSVKFNPDNTTAVTTSKALEVKVSAYANRVSVSFIPGQFERANLTIINIWGQEIYSTNIDVSKGNHSFEIQCPTGVYIAKVSTDKGVFSHKVYLSGMNE